MSSQELYEEPIFFLFVCDFEDNPAINFEIGIDNLKHLILQLINRDTMKWFG